MLSERCLLVGKELCPQILSTKLLLSLAFSIHRGGGGVLLCRDGLYGKLRFYTVCVICCLEVCIRESVHSHVPRSRQKGEDAYTCLSFTLAVEIRVLIIYLLSIGLPFIGICNIDIMAEQRTEPISTALIHCSWS